MTILSLRAVRQHAERYVRQHGPTPRAELVKALEAIDVPDDRADAGIRLAITIGRLADTPAGIAIPTTLDEGMAAA